MRLGVRSAVTVLHYREYGGDLQGAVAAVGRTVAASFSAQFLGTYLCATRRFDLYNLTSAGTGIVRAVLIVAALPMHKGVLFVAAVALVCSLLSLVVNASLLRSPIPLSKFIPATSKWPASGNCWDSAARHFWLTSVINCDSLQFHRDRPGSDGCHDHALQCRRKAADTVPATGAGPGKSLCGRHERIRGQHKHEELQNYFLLATRLTCLLSVFISLMLLVNGGPLIRFWVGTHTPNPMYCWLCWWPVIA